LEETRQQRSTKKSEKKGKKKPKQYWWVIFKDLGKARTSRAGGPKVQVTNPCGKSKVGTRTKKQVKLNHKTKRKWHQIDQNGRHAGNTQTHHCLYNV